MKILGRPATVSDVVGWSRRQVVVSDDSAEYPQTSSGNRFCIASFCDTRAHIDPRSTRLVIQSNSRHPLWTGDKYQEEYGTCGVYSDSNGNYRTVLGRITP